MIFHFTIGACFVLTDQAEGKGFEPSSRQARTALAERPGQPYPATFRSVDPPGVEPGSSDCQPDVFPLDHEPAQIQWTCRGVEPRSPGCKPSVFPLDEQPISDLC